MQVHQLPLRGPRLNIYVLYYIIAAFAAHGQSRQMYLRLSACQEAIFRSTVSDFITEIKHAYMIICGLAIEALALFKGNCKTVRRGLKRGRIVSNTVQLDLSCRFVVHYCELQ